MTQCSSRIMNVFIGSSVQWGEVEGGGSGVEWHFYICPKQFYGGHGFQVLLLKQGIKFHKEKRRFLAKSTNLA